MSQQGLSEFQVRLSTLGHLFWVLQVSLAATDKQYVTFAAALIKISRFGNMVQY